MAQLTETEFTLKLSLKEMTAIKNALGRMTKNDYPDDPIYQAGGDVYRVLSEALDTE